MPRVLTRSPIKMPGTRQCRLARRLAAGLSPAEIKRLDTATEEDIEAFVTDRDLSRLVEQYAAVRNLPLAAAAGPPVRDGLAGAFEPHRCRRPPRDALRRLSGEPRPASGKAPRQAGGRAAGPGAPALRAARHAFARRLLARDDAGLRPASAGAGARSHQPPRRLPPRPGRRGYSCQGRAEPAAAEAPVEEPAATTEEIPAGDAGDPASADSLSPLAAMARANPALADWIIARIEKRLIELGEPPEPDDPRRAASRKPLGP